MKLFSSLSKKQLNREEARYKIPYSRGFRGFRKFYTVVYGDTESEMNGEMFYSMDLSNSIFEFVCFNYDGGRMAQLYIDGKKEGAVFDPDQVYAIEHGFIEKIHAEPREEVVLENRRTITRHRLSILVKYR